MRVSRSVVAAAFALAACGVGCSSARSDEAAAAGSPGPLGRAFAASATSNGVPRDLLVAIAQTEGSLDMPRVRDVEPGAAVPVAGPLQLRRGKLDTLARGAALTGATELALRQDTDLALEAGARVLADVGATNGATAADLASWQVALEEMSGYADLPHRKDYARRVFALLARGGTFAGRDGEPIVLPAHDLPPETWMAVDTALHPDVAPADYGPAEWFPTSCTNKCTPGRAGNAVEFVVIHDTEGGWDASVATLQNDPQKSVQYIVGTDGRVGQFIHEVDTAWHAGNFSYNQRSIGIEHVGYSTKPYTNPQYAASALLVQHLTDKYKIAKDRAHIIGHDQIPNGNVMPEDSTACSDAPHVCEASSNWGGAGNHRDPGVWEWCTYMARFGGSCKCDDVTSVLNCSEDKTQAFRCVGGKVELDQCTAGCVTQPNGVDDVCNVAPKGSSGGTSGSSGGPSAPGAVNQLGPGQSSAPSGGGPGQVDPPAQTDPPSAAGGGCRATPTTGPSGGGAALLLAGVGLAAARRRRQGRTARG
jgi:MYXO-CTERM domain-containing protein